VTRQAIYIDEDDFNYLFSFPDGVDRIVQGATHEAAHIDNELANLNNPEVKLLSEAEIERIAPSDKVRKAMLERLMKKLNEEGGQKFDPKKDGALLASQLKNLTPAQIDAFQDKIYASMAALFASLTRKDINGDIFRDYDYRLRDEVIPPEIAFGMAVSWAKMAVQRAEKEGIKSRTAILARDCRLANPNVLKAIELGLRYVGLDVVYVGQESPNCVSDYSWAVRLTYKNGRGNVEQPILGVFRTSSHVALDKQINGFDAVDGFKVIIKSSREGELNSLTVPEIKTESRSIIEGLVGNPDNIKAAAAANTPGTYSTEDIKEGFVKMSALTARLAANPQPGRTVFDLDEAISTAPDVAELLKTWMQNVPPSRPMEGRTIVIDGAHTPSGALARKVFEALGARVILLNGEPRELSGMHRADPSKKANLAATMLAMTREKADLGLAFDLDGDRCAIMYAKKDVPQEVLAGFSRFDHNKSDEINNKDLDTIGVALSNYIEDMPPDNLIAVQLEFLIKQCGYTKEALAAKGKKGIVVIRDVLGTEAVDKVAEDLSRKTGIDIKCVTANAGYVYLKRLRAKYEAEGYVVAIYGESSGHGWTRATGPIENPITLSAMFGVMYSNYTSSPATLGRSVKDMMDEKIVVPYRRSGRFDPLYDKEFIKMLAALPEVPQQAKEQYASGKIPQIVIALGQDYVIRHIQKDFKVGNVVETGFGKLEVAQLDTWKDDGLYRYADIRFNLNGKYAGRCIFRASSNDPNFTCSFETPYIKDESQNDKYPEITRARFALVGGIFMNWLETQHEIERGKSVSFSPISDRPFKNNMMVLPQLVQARMAIGKLPESVVNVQDVYDLVRVMRPTFESLKSDASLKNNAVEYTIPAKSGAEYKLTVSYVQDKPGAFDLALSRNASGRTEELARKQINDVYEKIFKNNEFALGDFIDNAVKTIEKDVAPIELAAAQAAAAEKTFDHTLDVIMKSSDTGERARKLAEGVSAKAPPAKAGRHLIFVKSAIPDEQLKTTTVINYANFCADYYNELEGYTADIVDTYKDAIELLSKNKDWDKTNTIVGLIDSASLDQMASALKNEQMEGKTKLLSMERFSNDQFVPLKGFFDLMSVLVQVNRALDKPDDQELKDAIRELLDNIGVRDVDSLMKALSVAAYFEDPIKFAKNFIVKLLPPTKPASPTELRDRYNAAKKVIESL
jgi:phosphomannomutase